MDRLRHVLPPWSRIWDSYEPPPARRNRQTTSRKFPKRQILWLSLSKRNTAPAIGLAAHILQSLDPDALMGVFPADHVIAKPREYTRLLRPAFQSAAQGNIVVLGIQPCWLRSTGYGYIEFPEGVQPGARSAQRVVSFREKPDASTAESFLAAGNFYWNAGMFFWKTSVLLDALRRFLPKTAHLLAGLPPFTSRKFSASLAAVFPKCDNISIDYAVLERASNVTGIPAGDIGWNDVGSWDAVYELHNVRDALKATPCARRPSLKKSTGNYIDAEGKLVALLGVKDLIVVVTPPDALPLIADRSRAQEVGELVKRLEKPVVPT